MGIDVIRNDDNVRELNETAPLPVSWVWRIQNTLRSRCRVHGPEWHSLKEVRSVATREGRLRNAFRGCR